MRYFGGCSQRSAEQCRPAAQGGALGRESFVASSRILAKPVGDPAALVSLLDGRSGLDLLLDSLGGAVCRYTRPDETAFPHREALASAQIYATRRRTAVRDPAGARGPRGPGQVTGQHGYVNYIDPNMPDWETAYYGDNIPRLQKIAARYDPDRVFAFAQGIKPR